MAERVAEHRGPAVATVLGPAVQDRAAAGMVQPLMAFFGNIQFVTAAPRPSAGASTWISG